MANHTDSLGFYAAEVLQRTAARQPDKTAIIAKEEELTFAALNQRVQALAGHLIADGIRQGDRVGVLLPNSTAIPLAYYATQKIGAVTVICRARSSTLTSSPRSSMTGSSTSPLDATSTYEAMRP